MVKRRHIPVESKVFSVETVLAGKATKAQEARRNGVATRTISRWMQLYREGGLQTLGGGPGTARRVAMGMKGTYVHAVLTANTFELSVRRGPAPGGQSAAS